MRICVDLDGTICSISKDGHYAEASVLPGSIESLKKLQNEGHFIIIYTARRMRTHRGDPIAAEEEIGDITREWLSVNGVPFDELIFGKPYAHVYIDDLAVEHSSWVETLENIACIRER